MFSLYDERTQLYQWDLNRKVIVSDTTICEVHFCNRTSDCSLVVEPYWLDGVFVADIPNILLQDSRPIRVYAYCDDEYTLTEQQFTVKSRTKPTDYVYTQTEVITIQGVERRIDKLEETLEDYYTKEETDTAIYNSRDTYYLNFGDATERNVVLPATEDMVEFATRFLENKNVCLHIKPTRVTNWQSADVRASALGSGIIISTNRLEPAFIYNHSDTNYREFTLEKSTEDGKWYYWLSTVYTFALVTKKYVENAIADIDISEPQRSVYYLDFSDASADAKPATADMIEFATRYEEDKNVCAYIKTYDGVGFFDWKVADIRGSASVGIYFVDSGIVPAAVHQGKENNLCTIRLERHPDGNWVYALTNIHTFTLATQKYVDDAIANIDIPEPQIDAYTKDEIDGMLTPIVLEDADILEVIQALQAAINKGTPIYWLDDACACTLAGFDGESQTAYFHNPITNEYITVVISVEGLLINRIPDTNLSNYYTKAETEAYINNALGVIENGSY